MQQKQCSNNINLSLTKLSYILHRSMLQGHSQMAVFASAAAVSNKLLFPKHTSFQSFYSLLCHTLNPHDF